METQIYESRISATEAAFLDWCHTNYQAGDEIPWSVVPEIHQADLASLIEKKILWMTQGDFSLRSPLARRKRGFFRFTLRSMNLLASWRVLNLPQPYLEPKTDGPSAA